MLVLVKSLSYTPYAGFTEEFLHIFNVNLLGSILLQMLDISF